MMPIPRIKPTPPEQAFLALLSHVWPGGAGYPLDGWKDVETQKDAARLLDAGIVERIETIAPDSDEPAALYLLHPDFVGSFGATDRPQDN